MQPAFLAEPLRLAGGPILRLQSDERLVRLVRAGSHPAFGELVHRHRPALVRYTSRLVGEHRAEDVVQQGLANAHTALMSDDRPIEARPWLYRVVHNAALNLLRGERDTVALDDVADAFTVPGAEVQAEERAHFRRTLAAVQALPVAQRDALLLRELEGRSHEEIATALGVTPGAARQHLMRARVTMRAAVTAVTPYPLVLKLAGFGGAGGSAVAAPVAELALGAGAGAGLGLSKLAAGILAAGALVGGAGAIAPSVLPGGATADAVPGDRLPPAGPSVSRAAATSASGLRDPARFEAAREGLERRADDDRSRERTGADDDGRGGTDRGRSEEGFERDDDRAQEDGEDLDRTDGRQDPNGTDDDDRHATGPEDDDPVAAPAAADDDTGGGAGGDDTSEVRFDDDPPLPVDVDQTEPTAASAPATVVVESRGTSSRDVEDWSAVGGDDPAS